MAVTRNVMTSCAWIQGTKSYERLHEVKLDNYKKYGPIYKEKVGPGFNMVHVFRPEDLATVFRADGAHPHRPPLPITAVSNKREGFCPGLGDL